MHCEISIIIILYNGISYIHNCLESIFQDLESNSEIIIIDNASTDGGAELIARQFPSVQLVRNARNLGFGAACNQGESLAQGQVLIFLNQDTHIEMGCLASLVQPLQENQDIGLTTARQLDLSDPTRVIRCGNRIHFSGLSFPGNTAQMNQPAAVDSISGAAFAVRKAVWDSLGGFDPGYFMYYEDTDLSWRAWNLELATYFTPDAVVHHNAPDIPPTLALYYSARNRPTLLLKTFKLPTLMLLLPGLLLAELVDWAAVAHLGTPALKAKWRGLGWVFTNLGAICQRRICTQVLRAKPDWFLLSHCSPTLKPTAISNNQLLDIPLSLVNILFRCNYRAALTLCRLFNI